MVRDARKWGLWVVGLSGVLAAASALGPRGVAHLRRLDRDAARIEAADAALEAQNDRLILRIDALRNDPRTLESVARDELGMVKPGEVVFRFVPEAPRSAAPAAGASR